VAAGETSEKRTRCNVLAASTSATIEVVSACGVPMSASAKRDSST
jgi:hypothetical protein